MSCKTNHPDGAGNEMHYVEFAEIKDIELDRNEVDDEYFYVPVQKISKYFPHKFGFINCKIYIYDNISQQIQEVEENHIFSYPKEFAIKGSKLGEEKYMCVVKGKTID